MLRVLLILSHVLLRAINTAAAIKKLPWGYKLVPNLGYHSERETYVAFNLKMSFSSVLSGGGCNVTSHTFIWG